MAIPTASRGHTARSFSRTIGSLLAILLILVSSLPASAALPSPVAQEPVLPAAADAMKEHWIGIGSVQGEWHKDMVIGGISWEPGDATASAQLRFDLTVDTAGNVQGRIDVSWNGSISLNATSKALCDAAAGDQIYDHLGKNCTISPDTTSGSYTLNVTGTRTRVGQGPVEFVLETDPSQPDVKETLTGINPYDGVLWSHRRESYMTHILPPSVGMRPGGALTTQFGRPAVHYVETFDTMSDGGGIENELITIDVMFVEMGQEPTLELEKELLERSVFMNGVSVANALTAEAGWNTAGGGSTTWVRAQETETTAVSPEERIPRSVNVGTIGVGEHPVSVQGKDTLDRQTVMQALKLVVAPLFERCGAWTAQKIANIVSYRCSISIPEPALKASFNTPSKMPFFRGTPIGVEDLQFNADMELKSSTEGSVRGGAGATFKAMGGAAGGNIQVKIDLKLTPQGVEFVGGSIDLAISGKIPKTEALVETVPAFAAAMAALEAISPTAAAYVRDKGKVTLEIEPSIGVSILFERDTDGGWRFKDALVPLGMGFKVYIKIAPNEDVASLTAGVGGSVTLTLDFPGDPGYFESLELKFNAYFALQVWKFVYTGEANWAFSTSAAAAAASIDALDQGLAFEQVDAGSWQMVDRSNLTAPNYSKWVLPVTPPGTMPQGVAVENVGPLAQPAFLDLGDLHRYLVWSWDRPGSSALAGDEIAVANVKGSGTGTGVQVLTNDSVSDWSPEVIAGNGGRGWLVWQRMDTATPDDFNANPKAFLSHMQVAAGNFLRNNGPITGFQFKQISTSGSLNHRPQITNRQNGGMLAVWINNPGNVLLGDTTNQDQFMYSVIGSQVITWSAPLPAGPPIPGIIDYDLSTYECPGLTCDTALVYTADKDGNRATLGDVEVYSMTLRAPIYGVPLSTAWTAPQQVTNNNVDERNPQVEVVEDASGDFVVAHIAWIEGNSVLHKEGTAAPVARATGLAENAAGLEFFYKNFSDATFTFLWREGEEIVFQRYNDTSELWTAPGRVTPQPGGTLTSHSGGVNYADGILFVATQIDQIDVTTRTVSSIAYPNIPFVAEREIRFDLVPWLDAEPQIDAESVQVVAPPGGTTFTVNAVVENHGDDPAKNVVVYLVKSGAGEPAPSLLTQTTIPLIPGRGRVPVTLNATKPASSAYVYSLNVNKIGVPLPTDPGFLTTGPGSFLPEGSYVQAYVGQKGPLPYGAVVPTELRMGGADGPVIALPDARLPTAPATSVLISTAFTPTLLGPGRHLLTWTLDPEGLYNDPNPLDNSITVHALVMPDLHTEPLFASFSGGKVALRVWNEGNWASAATTADVWAVLPGTPGASPLMSLPIPALAPGQSIDIQGTVPAATAADAAAIEALTGVYVRVDPANLVEESNENANVMLAGKSSPGAAGTTRLFLPLVKK